MEKNHTEEAGTGVIIARFQVHELHEAHVELIDQVISKHKKVIIILGVGHLMGSKNNPLNFTARRLMIQEKYGKDTTRIEIIPMRNRRDDAEWSKEIDSRIREIAPTGKIVLYGSRDSFIPHYRGQFKTVELESRIMISGTEIRKNVSEETLSDPKFRAGIIHGLYNQYPRIDPCVDIAVMRDDEILLCKKPGEKDFRFVGGHYDITDANQEAACRRETMEETHCLIDELEHIAGMRIEDWRYRGEDATILTNFYLGYYQSGSPKPDDDIAELRWVNVTELDSIEVMVEHKPLMSKLIEFLIKKQILKKSQTVTLLNESNAD